MAVTLPFARTLNETPASPERRAAMLADPGFGNYFTDHQIRIAWSRERGWHDAELVPYGPVLLDPAANVLHFAQEIFEGLKAYEQPDRSVATFRPDQNARRLQASARRLALPELPEDLFVESLRLLVEQDRAWVPPAGGEASLYLRPLLFGTTPGLSVHPAAEVEYRLIASPAGSYFAGGLRPVAAWISREFVRAAPGGTGAAKTGGNYASSLAGQVEAHANGCQQVIWLDGVERRYVEEMGAMNLAFVFGEGRSARVVTPSLTGTLLAGVTRDSLLEIGRDLGYGTEERRVSVEEVADGVREGRVTEALACGTGAVVTPIGRIAHDGGSFTIGDGEPGPVTMRLRDTLTAIQRGTAEDVHGWRYRLV
ncbi:MAG: branched-chain amino acid aminotransferase [Candidatus Dormiibacterota bacterium]